ncbi:MAG: hypothetical protein ACPGVG_10400 [Mycobacterium sp.]
MAQFLDVDGFAEMFRPLSDVEANVAVPLLEVADRWIRDRKSEIADDDASAKVVVFEIMRSALLYGKYAGLSSFQETTSRSTKAGTLGTADVERFVTDRHRQMLGLALSPRPAYHFGD